MLNEPTEFSLTFLGAAGTVTGSKTLVNVGSSNVLVDCGLFQGLKELRKLNRSALAVDPKTIDHLVLTHAHLDHSGYIPVLVKNGFNGKIHCTHATRELTEVILKDSAKIQEEDAQRANRYHYTKHKNATPLYTQHDVEKSLDLFVEHNYNEWVILDNNIKFEILPNGHILGSGFVNFNICDKSLVFSGDMGQSKPLLLYPPKKIKKADYLIMESTYGDRLHGTGDLKREILKVIDETFAKKGILMIPTFAVERTQEILYILYQLRKEGLLPPMEIYLDSPMGIHATKIYDKYHELQNISNYEINRMYDDVHFVDDPVESKAICLNKKPKIVLAGSGMIEGGRILHYINNHADEERNTLLFVGFQGEGTRGRSILNGSKEIKFFGKYHPIKCKIHSISHLSAHADQADIIAWLANINNTPKKIFLNHGEKHQAEALCVKIQHTYNWDCTVPKMNQRITLPLND